MPIEYRIDPERRIVLATARGVLTADDLFSYQRSVWSASGLAGFDELVDLGGVTDVPQLSALRARDLAVVAARMDDPAVATRLAIVAPADFAYGLARMYATHRETQEHGRKQVRVFRDMAEAVAWLEEREGR